MPSRDSPSGRTVSWSFLARTFQFGFSFDFGAPLPPNRILVAEGTGTCRNAFLLCPSESCYRFFYPGLNSFFDGASVFGPHFRSSILRKLHTMASAVVRGPATTQEGRRVDEVLTPGAIDFLVQLHRHFDGTRLSLLQRRARRQQELLSSGRLPEFLPHTAATVRDAQWKVAPVPKDLQDRRVEITGPASSMKMVRNALGSGASCFMADLEDASTSWGLFLRLSPTLNLPR